MIAHGRGTAAPKYLLLLRSAAVPIVHGGTIVNRTFSLILELRGTTALPPVKAATYFTIHDVFELNYLQLNYLGL